MKTAVAKSRSLVTRSLNQATLLKAAAELASRDEKLQLIHNRYGPPPLWGRPQGFNTLIQIILEQQVSLASAASTFNRLKTHIKPFLPERFIELGADNLKTLGLTRQKTAYCLHLAESIVESRINLGSLARLNDEDAKGALIQLRGIGSWSADIYLLMALRRPDVWPKGDLALKIAVAGLWKMAKPPGFEELESFANQWRPYRAVAARMLWQYYLGQRRERSVS